MEKKGKYQKATEKQSTGTDKKQDLRYEADYSGFGHKSAAPPSYEDSVRAGHFSPYPPSYYQNPTGNAIRTPPPTYAQQMVSPQGFDNSDG